MSGAAAQQTITVRGEISDSQCAFDVHSNTGSHEEMLKSGVFGSTPADCIRACIRNGGKYVMVDNSKKKIYRIGNPDRVADFAARQVRVQGTLDQNGVLTIVAIELNETR
jgi:hypothetical protein